MEYLGGRLLLIFLARIQFRAIIAFRGENESSGAH